MPDQDVKSLLLQVDASVELLRKELTTGEQRVASFEKFVATKMRDADRSFLKLGTGLSGVRDQVNRTQSSMIALGATIGTYFSGRELVQLLDSFTKLQNNLRVAGVAGEQMKEVQDRLFVSAQKYGVELEALSKLFSSLSQASKELGASQEQVFKLTDAVSGALKIAGISSGEASGALLQLGQALRSPNIQAQEFNSLLDGLYPLLEAAAAGSDRWKGSVAKLTADVKASKVTSQEFFQAILKGSDVLEQKAAKATLTLSAGYTTLVNALTVYFGEADKANGVSAALGETLGLLAENLDTIVPALSFLIAALGTRYVVAATSAAASTLLTSNAMIALQARMAGAATTAEALSLAMSGVGKGGAATAAILALGGAFYYLATRENTAADAAERYREATSRGAQARAQATELARKLASATGEERRQTELAIAAALKKARADQVAGAAALNRARAELTLAQAAQARVEKSASANTTGRGSAELGTVRGETNRNLRLKTGEVQGLTASLQEINAAVKILQEPLKVPALPGVGTAGAPGASAGAKGRGGSGPSAADISERFNSERISLAQQALSAQGSLARSADERAEIELRGVELARTRLLNDIKSEKDYTAEQRKVLTAQIERVAELDRARVEFERVRQIEQEKAQLAEEEYRSSAEALKLQYDLTDSNAERRRLARTMVDLEIRHQRAVLQEIIASETASDEEKRRAQRELAGIGAVEQGRKKLTDREHETPGERYLRGLGEQAENLGEAYEDIAARGLDRLNDGLAEAAKNALGLHGILGDVIGDLIEIAVRQSIIGPLAKVLFGGGGLIGGIAGLFGGARAAGGPVDPSKAFLVGEKGPELFVPKVPGNIVSNGALRGGGGAPSISLVVNAPGATAETVAMVRRELAAAAPAIVQMARGATVATLQRPRLP